MQARLVVVLRDPVMRAFSHWRMVNEKELWKHLHYTPRWAHTLDPSAVCHG